VDVRRQAQRTCPSISRPQESPGAAAFGLNAAGFDFFPAKLPVALFLPIYALLSRFASIFVLISDGNVVVYRLGNSASLSGFSQFHLWACYNYSQGKLGFPPFASLFSIL
jgi:hypothetical protein